MLLFIQSVIWMMIISFLIHPTIALSYNRPKFCPNASWNPNAITFVDDNTIGSDVYGIFVNTNNTVYVADNSNNRILIWLEGTTSFWKNIVGGLNGSYSLFVTDAGDIYVDNGGLNGRVEKWTANGLKDAPAMFVNKTCFGLFIAINGNLYCSRRDLHQVVMKPLNSSVTNLIIVAGTNSSGATANSLYNPVGIFIDTNLTLYVADYFNHRVQRFPDGQRNGTTVAGSTAPYPFTLNGPTGIVLDGDGYLFIVDRDSDRIIGSGPNGFRCLVGCSQSNGLSSNRLNNPRTVMFDGHGNMFAADTGNNRIQKFLLMTNSCDETTTLRPTMTSTVKHGTSMVMSTSALITGSKSHSYTTVGKTSDQTTAITTTTTHLMKNSTTDPGTTAHLWKDSTTDPGTPTHLRKNPRIDPDTTTHSGKDSTANPGTTTRLVKDSTLLAGTTTHLEKDSTTDLGTTAHLMKNSTMDLGTTTHSPKDSTTDLVTTTQLIKDLITIIGMTTYLIKDSTTTTAITTQLIKDSITEQSMMASTIGPRIPFFIPPSCPNPNQIGINCSISANLCNMLKPCRNYSICNDSATVHPSYTCFCPIGLNGTNCEIDIRPCTCDEISNTTFKCSCQPGWTGSHCETKIDYCQMVRCLNNGVCRPLLLNFTCECLGTSYFGRYCEITSSRIRIYQTISKSCGFTAYISLGSTILFIIIMDALKYFFGIDPLKEELERIRKAKEIMRKKPPPRVIQRFIYVNQSSTSTKTKESTPESKETLV